MPKKDKNSFIFHLEWQEVLRDYSAEVRLEVYDAVIEYAASGSLPELEPLAKMAFAFIKKDIDHDNERRKEISEIKSINGRKGAQVKQMQAKQANASECKQNKQMLPNASKTSKCLQMVAKQANAFRETENEKDVSDGFPLQPFSLTSEKDKEKEKKESTPYGVLKKKAADAPFPLPLPMENPSGGTEEKPNPGLTNSENKERKSCAKKKDLKAVLMSSEFSDNAAECHNEVISLMQSHGFVCQREYPVDNRGDGHGGRIDIYASRDDRLYAIEIDRNSARDKSVFKLAQLSDEVVKIILLRGGDTNCVKDGIHYFSLKVKSISAPPSSPKRFVKPSVDEVRAYCTERSNGVDAQTWWDFYESKGWMVGSNHMKDWKAAVRTWEKRNNYTNNYGREKQQRFGATPPDDFAGKGSTKL